MELQLLLDKFSVLRDRPSRIVDVLREPRPIVRGGPLANRLGLQVARVLADHAAWTLRGRREFVDETIRAPFEELSREGVLVVRDFLPESDFAEVRKEFDASRSAPEWLERYRRNKFGENFVAEGFYASDYPTSFPALMRSFRDNEFLQKLASAACRRPMTFKPHVELFHVHKPDPDSPHVDLDYNQYIHADRHYPFIKAFYYLADVDADTAPYTYVPRSHQLSFERLRYEYLASVQTAKSRAAHYRRTEEQLAKDREIQRVSAQFLERLHAIERPIVAPANTLIVSNNQGFHRRGEMSGKRARSTVNLDFKYLESHAQWMFPVLKHLYR